MPLFEIVHRTRYHYARPVSFGQHRAMLRPRDSHDLRLHDTLLTIRPLARVHWLHDVFSNSIALLDFEQTSEELFVESRLLLERFDDDVSVEKPRGETIQNYPFSYAPEQVPDLGHTQERHYPDPDGKIADWAGRFVSGAPDTVSLLTQMMQAIKREFRYRMRNEQGAQTPLQTLAKQSGTCRDFALFMMEAARSLGFAARFVTGYLYDPAIDGQSAGIRGAGATHAWVQIFLPLSGWVEFDPTNCIVGGRNLVRVGVARDPSQAVPISGTYFGEEEDYLGMDVDVTVRAVGTQMVKPAALLPAE